MCQHRELTSCQLVITGLGRTERHLSPFPCRESQSPFVVESVSLFLWFDKCRQ